MTRVPEQPFLGVPKARSAAGRAAGAKFAFGFADALKSGPGTGRADATAQHADKTSSANTRPSEPFSTVMLRAVQRLDAVAAGQKMDAPSNVASDLSSADEDGELPTPRDEGTREDRRDDAAIPAPVLPTEVALPKVFGFLQRREEAGGQPPAGNGDEQVSRLGEPARAEPADGTQTRAASAPTAPAPDRPDDGTMTADQRAPDLAEVTPERQLDDDGQAGEAAQRAAPAGKSVKVSVEQSVPAPVQPTAPALAQAIVDGMKLADVPPPALARDIPATPAQQPFKVLKIELRPQELGTVTARLKAVGEVLSIEIEVETDDAYRQLSQDGEAIGRQLRALGYTVESVTILQPVVSAAATGRTEAAPLPQGGRGGESAAAGGGGGQPGSETGRQKGGNGHGGQDHTTPADHPRLHAGGGVYI